MLICLTQESGRSQQYHVFMFLVVVIDDHMLACQSDTTGFKLHNILCVLSSICSGVSLLYN